MTVDPSAMGPKAQEAAAAEQAAKTGQTTGSGPSAATTIRNMADLKTQSPELYQETMKSIAMTILRQVKRSQKRLEEIQRKAREQNK